LGAQARAAGVLGVAAAVLAGVAFVWGVGRGFWATMCWALGGLHLAGFLPASWAEPGRHLDRALSRLGPWRAAGSLGCFVAGWAVGAAEIYLILHWVGGAVEWP